MSVLRGSRQSALAPQDDGRQSVTMDDMVRLCLSEAARLDLVQNDLVAAGVQARRSGTAERRIRIYGAIVELIDIVRSDRDVLAKVRAAVTARGAARHPSPRATAGDRAPHQDAVRADEGDG